MSFSVCSIDKGAFLHMVMEVCFSLPIYKTPNLDAFGFGFLRKNCRKSKVMRKAFGYIRLTIKGQNDSS